MPPMKPAKPSGPKQPKKPTSKSKTGNSACSQAASNWQLSIRGKEPLDPQTYATLAKCRAMSRTAKQADSRAAMGYNLNEQGAAALKGRLQKRFDQGLITQKSRDERLKTLLAERKVKQAQPAKPADKAASLVSSVRQKPGYGVARASARGNQELAGLRAKDKQKAANQGQQNAVPKIKSIRGSIHVTQHERNSIYQGFDRNAKEWKTQRKHYKVLGQNQSGATLVITDNMGKRNETQQRVVVTFESSKGKSPPSKPAFSLKQESSQGGTGAGRSMGLLFQTQGTALDKAAQAGQKAPLAGQTGLFTAPAKPAPQPKNIEKIVSNQQLPSSMLRGGQNKKGYVAKIKGPDPKYKLEREFVKPSSSSATGAVYNIKDRGIYETQDYQRNNAYRPERTYELVGRNKNRPLFETVPGADKLNRVSVDRIARLLKLFSKK